MELIQNFLVTALAQTSRMVRSVLVRAHRRHLLVAFGVVAEVAEELGLVPPIVMGALTHLVYVLCYDSSLSWNVIAKVNCKLARVVIELHQVL